MNKAGLRLGVLAAAVALAGALWWWLETRPVRVAVVSVTQGPVERVLAVNGRIRPRLEVAVRANGSGQLAALPFDVGDAVSAGAEMARIDDAPEAAAIAAAEAGVAAQGAVLAQARRELARFEGLGDFATRREVERRRLEVSEGGRELARRRAVLAQARELRARRVLRAPFDGVVTARPVDPGQMVGPETVIYRLADLRRPQVSLEVDEIYAGEISAGMTARVALPGQGEVSGTVAFIEPRVDAASGARTVRLDLDEDVDGLAAGLTVTANLLIERRASALSVPRGAVMQGASGAEVRVVGADEVVEARAVAIIDWPAVRVIVTRGLAAGERILAAPDAAAPGARVRPQG